MAAKLVAPAHGREAADAKVGGLGRSGSGIVYRSAGD